MYSCVCMPTDLIISGSRYDFPNYYHNNNSDLSLVSIYRLDALDEYVVCDLDSGWDDHPSKLPSST